MCYGACPVSQPWGSRPGTLGTTPVALPYRAFHPEASPIVDLVHATGVLCVHGSGFGMNPADGYFRMVTLAPPEQLNEIWDLIAGFAAGYK